MAERFRALIPEVIPAALHPCCCRLRLTTHAVERCQERVAPMHSYLDAQRLLETMARFGHVRKTPKHWMRTPAARTPGLSFLYWSELPDVCGLVMENSIITVLTRSMFSRVRPLVRMGGRTRKDLVRGPRRRQSDDFWGWAA